MIMTDYRVYQYYTSGFKVLRGMFSHKDRARIFVEEMRKQNPESFYDLVEVEI